MTALPTPSPASLADRLGNVQVAVRDDLEVSRTVFRGEPSYIVRDPLTFQSQRLTPANYEVLTAIRGDRTLAAVFSDLVESERAEPDAAQAFYTFVMSLHRNGFLSLPLSDEKILYRRFQARQQAKRRAALLSFLFLRIPIWNPNAFLDRTVRYARPLFTRTAVVIWMMLVAAALYVCVSQWHRVTGPFQGLLATRNLFLMWLTLIVLKVFHEFGHAYACKRFGGHVPDMGVYMILFTPCAYVDATASWGFAYRRERLFVCLAGMYVESAIAAIAVFVWAMTESSLINALAYNVMILASAVTILFNINPLMRFDGYYIMSDLIEVPNLRQRSTNYVLGLLKWLTLGLPCPPEPGGWRMRTWLTTFGIAATLYRLMLVVTISALLATKMVYAGLALAAAYLGSAFLKAIRQLSQYLWFSEEAAPVRARAVAVSLVVMVAIPAGLVLLPVPAGVHAEAVVTAEREFVVRAPADSFLTELSATPGDEVSEGSELARLSSDFLEENLLIALANRRASRLRLDAYVVEDLALAAQERAKAAQYDSAVAFNDRLLDELTVRAPHAGRVVQCPRDRDLGRFMNKGTPLAMVTSGKRRIRAYVTEEDLARISARVGDPAVFRSSLHAGRDFDGFVAMITPSSVGTIPEKALTQVGGGSILIDETTGRAGRPYYRLDIELTDTSLPSLPHGTTGVLRFAAQPESIATTVYMKLAGFLNRLMQQ